MQLMKETSPKLKTCWSKAFLQMLRTKLVQHSGGIFKIGIHYKAYCICIYEYIRIDLLYLKSKVIPSHTYSDPVTLHTVHVSTSFVHVYLKIVHRVHSCWLFSSCRMDLMVSTGLQRVAMSALSNTSCLRWSPCSTAQLTSDPPCYTWQLSSAILKWWGLPLMTTSWTPMRMTRCVVRHAGVLQRAVGPVVGCVMEGDMW